jgi:PBP1b-binding outer membrane lipoprotein LpoB
MKKTIILSLVLALLVSGCAANTVKVKDLTPEEAKAKTLDYINNQLLVDSESKATI